MLAAGLVALALAVALDVLLVRVLVAVLVARARVRRLRREAVADLLAGYELPAPELAELWRWAANREPAVCV